MRFWNYKTITSAVLRLKLGVLISITRSAVILKNENGNSAGEVQTAKAGASRFLKMS